MSSNPPQMDPRLAPALATALLPLGPWGALAALAFQFGEPFVAGIIQNAHDKTDPTPENWAALSAKIQIPFKDL